MKFSDILIISQRNLLRAKLRTLLTIGAVFIGIFAISLTNGLGSGIRSYVDRQLGNLGAKDIFLVQAKSTGGNPISSDVNEYNPDRPVGGDLVTFLNSSDIPKIQAIPGVKEVTPLYNAQIEYISRGGKKYQASASQWVPGLNIEMASGTTIPAGYPHDVTIPTRYVAPLGFSSAQDAVGKTIALGYKSSTGQIIEVPVYVAGIQESSLVGNAQMYVTQDLMKEIHLAQASPAQLDRYIGFFARVDASIPSDTQKIDDIKQKFSDANFTAQTLEDQVGTIGKVISSILVVLNVFGAIALLAATFGIVNTLFMAVNERTSEIGLMKALGANRRTIFTLFSLEAASIGFWGSALAIGSSVVIGSVANRIATNTFLKDFVGFKLLAFPVLPFLAILLGGIVLALIAGALPSLKASRLDPIRALRYE